jgi:hypothetical protein
MATVLTFIAWSIDIFLSVVTGATAAALFLASPTFRRQSFERWIPHGRAVSQGEVTLFRPITADSKPTQGVALG